MGDETVRLTARNKKRAQSQKLSRARVIVLEAPADTMGDTEGSIRQPASPPASR